MYLHASVYTDGRPTSRDASFERTPDPHVSRLHSSLYWLRFEPSSSATNSFNGMPSLIKYLTMNLLKKSTEKWRY